MNIALDRQNEKYLTTIVRIGRGNLVYKITVGCTYYFYDVITILYIVYIYFILVSFRNQNLV